MKYVRCNLKTDNVDKVISKYGLNFKSDFAFYDLVYVNKNGASITEDTLKIRVYQVNHWKNKNVLVIRKIAPIVNGSKEDKVLLREEFDTAQEAQAYVDANLLNEYDFAFKLQKTGVQYGNEKVDLWKEDVEGIGLSVEVGSNDTELIDAIFSELDVNERLTMSLPEYMYEKIRKSNHE